MAIQHEDATQIHMFAHVDTVDPGAVGPYKAWVDTNFDPPKLKYRNAANTAWIDIGLGGGGSVGVGGVAMREIQKNLTGPYGGWDLIARRNDLGEWASMSPAELKIVMGLYNVPDVDATLRSNHTGTQTTATISNFNSVVDGRIAASLLSNSVIVFDGNTSPHDVNGVYTERGVYTSKPFYTLEGYETSASIRAIYNNGSYWYITSSGGADIFRSLVDGDTPFGLPFVSSSLDPMLLGNDPAPTVKQDGLRAVRTALTPQTSSVGSTLTFYEGTSNGTNYVEITVPASLALSTAIQLPYSVAESGSVGISGSSNSFVTTLGIQELTSKIFYCHAGLTTDDTANGLGICNRNSGAALAQWDAVYMGPSSTWLLADADGSGTYPARGLVVSAVAGSGILTKVLTQGTVRNDAWNWTVNGAIYLSTTAGGLTQTAPSASGDKVQIVGWAITADIAYFDFNSIYTTVP